MNISEYANRENDEPLVGLIFVGNSNSKIADELETDALRFGFEITISMSFAFEVETNDLQVADIRSSVALLNRNTKFSVRLAVLQMSR